MAHCVICGSNDVYAYRIVGDDNTILEQSGWWFLDSESAEHHATLALDSGRFGKAGDPAGRPLAWFTDQEGNTYGLDNQ